MCEISIFHSAFSVLLRYGFPYFFAIQLSPLICVVYIFEDCMYYALIVLFWHIQYYLKDNQANVIVICAINWINKHWWYVECCKQKHENIFANHHLFVGGTTLLTKYILFFEERKTNKFLLFISIYFFSFIFVFIC